MIIKLFLRGIKAALIFFSRLKKCYQKQLSILNRPYNNFDTASIRKSAYLLMTVLKSGNYGL